MAESPLSTPKRKRSQMLNDGMPRLDTTTQFTFDLNSTHDDDNASPRTRVAHRFRGLALGGGGGGSGASADLSTADNDADDGSRKRMRLPEIEMRDADSHSPSEWQELTSATLVGKYGGPGGRLQPPKSVPIALDDAVVEQTETIANTGTVDDSNTSTPTPDSPPSTLPSPPYSQPRRRSTKRAGTPPFPTKPASSSAITDPLRSSLTWHDDEITIYDPDDSDDDGTGINGIGFKPTPAIAHARTVRRRQQLAEYRKREEREARAKRSLRRRGESPAPGLVGAASKTKGKGERRKVRFLEREGGGALVGV